MCHPSGHCAPPNGTAFAPTKFTDLWRRWREVSPNYKIGAGAPHRWAHFILSHAATLSVAQLEMLFSAVCPASGDPIWSGPSDDSRTFFSALPLLGGGEVSGAQHLCCAPCACTIADQLVADKLIVTTRDGPTELLFTAFGDPCGTDAAWDTPFHSRVHGANRTLRMTSPDVRCGADGRLAFASRGEGGGVISGMLLGGQHVRGHGPGAVGGDASATAPSREARGGGRLRARDALAMQGSGACDAARRAPETPFRYISGIHPLRKPRTAGV